MGPELLRLLRFCLVILAFALVIVVIHGLRLDLFIGNGWATWLPLVLAVISDISYIWALKAQMAHRNIIQSNMVRNTCAFLLCVAWLVSPSYEVNFALTYYHLSGYNTNKSFFSKVELPIFVVSTGFSPGSPRLLHGVLCLPGDDLDPSL
ncbi:MAG: hypothetical protein J3Q66DRAFT_347627 [Benniella sp.]|nr:MAG: hypothetical protein J3Q66DRAFT_347627 [Benniella sp.]